MGTALVSMLALFPGQAQAQTNPTNGQLWDGLKATMKDLSDWTGYLSGVGTAIDYLTKIQKFLGLVAYDTNARDEALEFLHRWYKASDVNDRNAWLTAAWAAISEATRPLNSNQLAIQAGTYTGWDELEGKSIHAISNNLAPGTGRGFCENVSIFQVMSKDGEALSTSYDWRLGMQTIMVTVASRLAYFTARNPNFRNDSLVQTELDQIRTCLGHHRDLIRAPLPAGPYCRFDPPYLGGGFVCKEQRTWPQWTITEESPAYTGRGANDVASAVDFVDVESRYANKVDEADMGSVVFNLQRQMDNLYVMSHPWKGDLAEKEDVIRFGAQPQFCLSVNQSSLVLDTCSAPNAHWTYDRSTGQIKNKAYPYGCVSSNGFPPTGAFVTACTSADVMNEAQLWSWNPETGLIKNQAGAVLTVTPSGVSSLPENAWRYRQQSWRSDGATECGTVALCPHTGPSAWNQGKVFTSAAGYQALVSYPMDFNIFAYSDASGFYDVEFPIAVAGNCEASGFNLDRHGNHHGAALIAGGNLPWNKSVPYPWTTSTLANGTIHGFVYLPWWATMSNVTVPSIGRNGQPPEVPGYTGPITNEKPINFEMAFVDLDAWSQSLANLSSNTGKVRFTGSGYNSTTVLRTEGTLANPKLEVFTIDDWELRNARSLQFSTPAPTILVNVKPLDSRNLYMVWVENMEMKGFEGKNILWNFPMASYVEMRSVTFRGNVLAPRAYVKPDPGAVQGTMVAWKMIGGAEFYGKTLETYQDIK